MTKSICLFLLSLALIPSGWSQSISPQVIASSGKSSNSGGNIIDYTIGELVVTTLNTSGNIITQGFHQTYTGSSFIEDGSEIQFTIQVFPNPTYDFINLSIHGDKQIDFAAYIYDNYGRVVINKLCSTTSKLQIDLCGIAPGTYYVLLTNLQTNILIKTIQIQKLSNL